jgi:hypothetical protein
MRVAVATLCDSATIREGLLHILGGGVTTLLRSPGNATLGVQLALLLEFDPDEAGRHQLAIRVHDVERDVEILAVDGGASFDVEDGSADPTIPLGVPIVLPLQGVPLKGSGQVRITVSFDQNDVAVLRARVDGLDAPEDADSGDVAE